MRLIPQEIISQHTPREWIDSAFEILLARALFGDLPYLSEGYPFSPVGFCIIQPLDYGSPYDRGPIRPINMRTFFLTRDQIHNINIAITLSARDGFPEAASYLSRWLVSADSWSKVSEYYLALENRQEQRLHSVNSNGFRYIRESADYYNPPRGGGIFRRPAQVHPVNCCRSCGRKVPLTAGLCEECQKVESLMKDCFDTNVSLTNHVGQTYEEGIIGGVD